MIIGTKAQILPLKSTKLQTMAAIGNELGYLAGAAESGESDFDRALEVALSREAAQFNFVFDYPENEHARSLYSGCRLNRVDRLPLSGQKIP
jgi:hypothetical protein